MQRKDNGQPHFSEILPDFAQLPVLSGVTAFNWRRRDETNVISGLYKRRSLNRVRGGGESRWRHPLDQSAFKVITIFPPIGAHSSPPLISVTAFRPIRQCGCWVLPMKIRTNQRWVFLWLLLSAYRKETNMETKQSHVKHSYVKRFFFFICDLFLSTSQILKVIFPFLKRHTYV